MSLLRSSSQSTLRRRERLAETLLQTCGSVCFGMIEKYASRADRERLDGQLTVLLSDASAAHDLTVTCELLFLRFTDRVISVQPPEGERHQRLIQGISGDRYAVIDRYAWSTDASDEVFRCTVTLFGPQYLGPRSFDREGLRLTFGSGTGCRLLAQRLRRRADRLADAVRDDPSLNLQRGCQSIEYTATSVPDPVAVTRLLESAEPLSFDVIG